MLSPVSLGIAPANLTSACVVAFSDILQPLDKYLQEVGNVDAIDSYKQAAVAHLLTSPTQSAEIFRLEQPLAAPVLGEDGCLDARFNYKHDLLVHGIPHAIRSISVKPAVRKSLYQATHASFSP